MSSGHVSWRLNLHLSAIGKGWKLQELGLLERLSHWGHVIQEDCEALFTTVPLLYLQLYIFSTTVAYPQFPSHKYGVVTKNIYGPRHKHLTPPSCSVAWALRKHEVSLLLCHVLPTILFCLTTTDPKPMQGKAYLGVKTPKYKLKETLSFYNWLCHLFVALTELTNRYFQIPGLKLRVCTNFQNLVKYMYSIDYFTR